MIRAAGYAIVFNTPSVVMGQLIETIDPTALDALGDLNDLDVRLLIEHDQDRVVARTTNGTLQLFTDEHGVGYRAALDPTDPDVQTFAARNTKGLINQMSFGFRQGKQRKWTEGQHQRAHVTEIAELFEISIVSLPAYPSTSIEVHQ